MERSVQIRVLIADDNEDTRLNIRRMLSFDRDVLVVGDACDGVEAVQKSRELQPDIVLMDINMPKMDGLMATEKISIEVPGCAVVVISVQGEQEYLQRAMMAGARSYLVKPFNSDELVHAVKNVYQMEYKKQNRNEGEKEQQDYCQVVTVFGTKGGVGKTTLAVNLAVLLAKKKKKVALLDLDLQFGDVTIFLNLYPRRTLSELVQEGDALDLELLESNMIRHNSGVKILPAPGRPEYAELVTPSHVEEIIKMLKVEYDYIIIDTAPLFNEINLGVLDLSTQILLVLGMEGETITLQDIFVYESTGLDEHNRVKGNFRATGVRPKFMEKLAALGVYLPNDIFQNNS